MDAFWIGIGLALLVLVALTWIGAAMTRPRRRDPEDTPVVPGHESD